MIGSPTTLTLTLNHQHTGPITHWAAFEESWPPRHCGSCTRAMIPPPGVVEAIRVALTIEPRPSGQLVALSRRRA